MPVAERRSQPPNTRPDGTPFVERRRRGPDPVTRVIQISSVLAWATSIIIIFLLVSSRPSDNQNAITRILGFDVAPTGWNYIQLRIAFLLILFTFVICAAGIISNALRHKRKTDRFRISLFVFLGISIVGLVVFVSIFGIPF